MKQYNVLTIGGGSGHFVLLSGLRDIKKVSVTAIVSMADSGGSTGRLRDEMGVLPPGDVLKCLVALSQNRNAARKILQTRFNKNERLKGHNAGNFLLTSLSRYAGDFSSGVEALGEVLGVRGKVLPVSTDKATLVAELIDGSMIYGEAAIDIPREKNRKKIKRTFLVPHHCDQIKPYPPVLSEIKKAKCIIIGPGDLYGSIMPNFLVNEISEAVKSSKAKLIYVCNIMTKYGETDNFSGEDFVLAVEKIIKRKFDVVVFNSAIPDKGILNNYKKQKAELVKAPVLEKWGERKIIKKDMLNTKGDMARHDAEKLKKIIEEVIK